MIEERFEAADFTSTIVSVVAAHVEEAIAAYELGRDDWLARIIKLRVNRLDEKSRRQMEGLTLTTTYNMHRVRTLAALVTQLRNELKPLLIELATKRLLLEFAELELAEYKAADERNVEDRRVKAEAGLYLEPAAFADAMFKEHGIDRGGYAALTDSDLQAIAQIIKERVNFVNSCADNDHCPVQERHQSQAS